MKSLIVLIIGLTVSPLFGQDFKVSTETGLITYERILTFDTIKAEQLFTKTKGWFVEYFRESKEVIRGENKPDLIKGTFMTDYPAPMKQKQPIESDITVRIKDGAIKVIITKFITAPPTNVMPLEKLIFKNDGSLKGGAFEKLYKDIEINCQGLTDNLKITIEKAKSDW